MLHHALVLVSLLNACIHSLPLEATSVKNSYTSEPRSTLSGPCVPMGDSFPSQYLRTLPLGASITWGTGSTSGNGYRETLREKLVANGAQVNMIGSVEHGTMSDNQNEGWPGYRVDQVNVKANNDLSALPNLILINAGTNDVAQDYQLDTVDQRLESMVNKLLDDIPDTTVIVSTVLFNRNSTKQALSETVNKKYISMVQKLADAGKHVYLSDMSAITAADIQATDGTHPTDAGYDKMADIWYSAVQKVYAKCWITAPATVV